MSHIQVIFDNPLSTYYSGGKVAATVVINADQPKKIRELTLKFLGAAYVQWSEFEQERRSSEGGETVYYTAQETVFENQSRVCGETTLPIGRHTYNVAGFLPPNAPGSFEGELGHIRYTLTVTLVRAWAIDEDLTVPFTVIYPVDINLCAAARERLLVESSKTVGCCCWKSGPLSATLHAPITGYTPDQAIPVTVEIENLSNANVTDAICSVAKIVTYNARYPASKSKVVSTEIATVQLGQVGANGENTWTRDIILPNNLPTTDTVFNLIKISYELKLKTTVSKACSYGISLSAPVIICSTTPPTQPTYEASQQYAQHMTPAYSQNHPQINIIVAPPGYPTSTAAPYYPQNTMPAYPPQNAAYPQEHVSKPSDLPSAPPPPYSVAVGPNPAGWVPQKPTSVPEFA